MPSSSDQTRVGRTLTLGGGAGSSLEGSDIELLVSPKDTRTSPYDLCANRSDRRQSGEGTDGSNPLPSSGESVANLPLARKQRACIESVVCQAGDRGFESRPSTSESISAAKMRTLW